MRSGRMLLAMCLALSSLPALAQDAGRAGMLEEVVVTAQRREQNAMDVPLSIQVASGEQLERQGIRDLTSLQLTTPGYMTQTNSGFTQIHMRGIGNAIFLGADPSVATFVDDVPRIYGSMADNLFDVQRVEILKGAQGGLYGRNATGGVVNIVTRQPTTDEVKGDFLVSYGTKDTFRAAGFINLPVSDKVALSLSGERASHDPYVKNWAVSNPYTAANFPTGAFLPIPNGTAPIEVSPGMNVYGYSPEQTAAFFNSAADKPKLSDQDFWGARAKLLVEPTDDLRIVLAADYYKKDDNTGAGQLNVTPGLSQNALQAYFGLFGVDAVLPPGFVPEGTEDFTSFVGFPAITPVREHGFSAHVVWNTRHFEFTSITAHRQQRTDLRADVNNINVPTALLHVKFDKEFTYQELRAVSNFEGPWRAIFGGSYLENEQEGGQVVALLHPAFEVGNGFVADKIKNWSVYGELGYGLTDRLNLTGSLRYMRERNEARFTRPIESDAKTVQDKFIPALTLDYALDGGNAYLRWARGFKTGGINLATAPAYYPRPEDGSIFGPEIVDTYEIGYKQALLHNNLQLTAAVFYNDYKDLQVDTRARPEFPQLTTAIINAESARTWGVEGSALWRVTDPLTLGVTAGYLDAKYRDFRLLGSAALEDFDQSGMRMPKSPEWQLSFSADFDQPLNDRLRLVSNLLVSHVSEVIFQRSPIEGVIPDAIGPSYWLVNARVGVRTTDDKYGFAIVADNVFDEGYYVFGQSAVTGVLAGWGSPRIVRGEVTMKF